MSDFKFTPELLEQFRKLSSGFYASRVLLTANNLGVFKHCSKPITAVKLASILQTDLRATTILLDALTGLALLSKIKNKYCSTDFANTFLSPQSPYYQGNILKHLDSLWQSWSELDRVIKTGKPAKCKKNLEAFILGMNDIAKLKVQAVVDSINLEGYKTVIDIGGGPGTYAREFANRGLEVTLMDFAKPIQIAKKLSAQSGIKNITYIVGDIVNISLGKTYDVVFLSQLLHAFDASTCQEIVKKCAKALNPKGILVIQEFYIDDTMSSPLKSALFSVNMLVNTKGGRCYTISEMSKWCKVAGLKAITTKHINDAVLVIAKH